MKGGIPSDSVFLTHNESIRKKLQRLGCRVISIKSILPSTCVRFFGLLVILFVYWLIAGVFRVLMRKRNISVYHDIQGYGLSDYLIINTLRKSFPVYRYVDVELPDLESGRELGYLRYLFGLSVIEKIASSERFYYFPTIPGELTVISGSCPVKAYSRYNNVIFLYLGGVVESGLCSTEIYISILKSLVKYLPISSTYIKMHPRFSEFRERAIFEDFQFLQADIPSELFVGEDCIAIGFQSYALTNESLCKAMSILKLLETTDQNRTYTDYLLKNNKDIILPRDYDEISKILEEHYTTIKAKTQR